VENFGFFRLHNYSRYDSAEMWIAIINIKFCKDTELADYDTCDIKQGITGFSGD
jgi:hypothetical protein